MGYWSRIPQIIAESEARAALVVRKTVFDIEGSAKEKAPVDTGNLQNSVAARMTGNLSGEIEATAEYAGYVELGTRHMGAQPYMVPSAEEHRGDFYAAMRQIV